MNKIRHTIILAFLSIVVVMSSCYKEDMSDCPQGNLSLRFSLIMDKYNFNDIVEDLTLYQYNAAESLIGKYSFTKEQLIRNNYTVYLDKPDAGTYTFVVLANIDQRYLEVIDENHREDFLLKLITSNDYMIRDEIGDAYQGYKDIVVDDDPDNSIDENIALTKHTNNIDLEVRTRGYEDVEKITFSSNIAGTNGEYDYQYHPLPSQKITYMPHKSVASEPSPGIEDEFRIMRMWIGDDLVVNVEGKNERNEPINVEKLNLTKTIAQMRDSYGNYLYNTDDKLEMEDEYYVYMILEKEEDGFIIAEVHVNGWEVVDPIIIL